MDHEQPTLSYLGDPHSFNYNNFAYDPKYPIGYIEILADDYLNASDKFLPIYSGLNVIGRGKDCNIKINNGFISLNHACIEATDEAFFIYDLNSKNGSFAEGCRFIPMVKHPLHFGDKFNLSFIRCTFVTVWASKCRYAELLRQTQTSFYLQSGIVKVEPPVIPNASSLTHDPDQSLLPNALENDTHNFSTQIICNDCSKNQSVNDSLATQQYEAQPLVKKNMKEIMKPGLRHVGLKGKLLLDDTKIGEPNTSSTPIKLILVPETQAEHVASSSIDIGNLSPIIVRETQGVTMVGLLSASQETTVVPANVSCNLQTKNQQNHDEMTEKIMEIGGNSAIDLFTSLEPQFALESSNVLETLHNSSMPKPNMQFSYPDINGNENIDDDDDDTLPLRGEDQPNFICPLQNQSDQQVKHESVVNHHEIPVKQEALVQVLRRPRRKYRSAPYDTGMMAGEAIQRRTRSSMQSDVRVLFTGLEPDRWAKIIKQLGGTVVNSIQSATHVVSGSYRRTLKLMLGVIHGLPVVYPQWLHECRTRGYFVDSQPFLLEQLQEPLKRSRANPGSGSLLKDYKIFVTPGVQPGANELKEMVEACGGEFYASLKSFSTVVKARGKKIILVSTDEDLQNKKQRGSQLKKAAFKSAALHGIEILNVEFLLNSFINQVVDSTSAYLLNSARDFNESDARWDLVI